MNDNTEYSHYCVDCDFRRDSVHLVKQNIAEKHGYAIFCHASGNWFKCEHYPKGYMKKWLLFKGFLKKMSTAQRVIWKSEYCPKGYMKRCLLSKYLHQKGGIIKSPQSCSLQAKTKITATCVGKPMRVLTVTTITIHQDVFQILIIASSTNNRNYNITQAIYIHFKHIKHSKRNVKIYIHINQIY